MNTSKNELLTDEKKKHMLEFKVSIKKDKASKQEVSLSAIYSPDSKPNHSSQKKKTPGVSNSKKLSGKKVQESLKANSSSKLRTLSKLGSRSVNTSNMSNPKRGYSNAYKKKKAIQSESKKNTAANMNQFHDISEIQEFNVTDEESLINSSILKNIEDHESIHHPEGVCRESTKKTKPTSTKKSMLSTIKKPKKSTKKVKKMKFISSAKKSSKTRKKSQTEMPKETDRKSGKKRKVVFHISKQKEATPLETQHATDEELIPEDKIGQIKKVEFVEPKDEDTENEIINLNVNGTPEHYGQSSVSKAKFEKIEMINSEKLSELLSSKKKHRYKPVQDSMDGYMDENIGQQINFTDEEEHLRQEEYNSQDPSKVSFMHDSLEHNIDNLVEDRGDSVGEDSRDDDEVENEITPSDSHASLPPLHEETDSPVESYEDPEKFKQSISKELVIKSMTYQQELEEQNDIIEDSVEENQTVINCTQSDLGDEDSHSGDEESHNRIGLQFRNSTLNLQSESDLTSCRNVVVDDYSTELAHLHMATHSSEDVAQISISKNDNLITNEEYEYSYQEEDSEMSQEDSEEDSENEEEITSRLDYQFDQKHPKPSCTESEDECSEDLIKEISEEDLYNEDSNQHSKNYFEKTLTNMRIAFGSEQRVRENSVKTLEKMEYSVEGSNSGKKTEEKSSIFEKKSFQDFSLKKFTELMQVKNMKNFQNSMQKTFREYNKTKILSASDKKNQNNRTSSTPKKSKCISPRKFSMKDLELDRIGYEKMKENSEKKNKFINQIIGSSSSQNRRNNSSILYKTNLSIDKCRKEINMNDFSEEAANSVTHLGYKGLSPCKNNFSYEKERPQSKELLGPINQPQFDSPEPSKSIGSNPSSRKKISKPEREEVEILSLNETPYEDENIETVKLDSSRLRSQKRGLPMEERS